MQYRPDTGLTFTAYLAFYEVCMGSAIPLTAKAVPLCYNLQQPKATTDAILLLSQETWQQLQTFLEQQGGSDPRALDLTSRLQRLCQQQLVQLGGQPQPPE